MNTTVRNRLGTTPDHSDQDGRYLRTDLFDPDHFRPSSMKRNKEVGAFPNCGYHDPKRRIGCLVIGRAPGGDFAVSENGLLWLRDLVKQDFLKRAYVVLAEGKSGDADRSYVSHLTLNQFIDMVKPYSTDDHGWGPYWWVSETFELILQNGNANSKYRGPFSDM